MVAAAEGVVAEQEVVAAEEAGWSSAMSSVAGRHSAAVSTCRHQDTLTQEVKRERKEDPEDVNPELPLDYVMSSVLRNGVHDGTAPA